MNGKRVDLAQLKTELTAAGITVAALGQVGDDLHTYNAAGETTNLPAAAAAVITNHTPPPIPATPDFGSDTITREQIAETVANLRSFLPVASPTNAQVIAVVKLLIRVNLFLIRRLVA